jgi:hypothetical protein
VFKGGEEMEFADFMALLAEKLGVPPGIPGDEGLYSFTLKTKEERKQIVHASIFEEEGMKIIRCYTPVGKREKFSEKELLSSLELNSSLKFGGCALYEENLTFMETMPFPETSPDTAAAIIGYLAQMADSYEQMTLGLDRN